MTTYNTGNPIGSTDSRDRLDNTENMDYLENSTTKLTHPDRLGTVRKTRHGMEVEHDNQIAAHESEHDNQIAAHESEHDAQMQAFESDFDGRLAGMAFTRVGSFTSGATLADMRQVLVWEVSQGGDGHEYGWTGSFLPSGKVVIAGSSPETSGGIGAGAWVDRTDLTLRGNLSALDGVNLVNGAAKQSDMYTARTLTDLQNLLSTSKSAKLLGSISVPSTGLSVPSLATLEQVGGAIGFIGSTYLTQNVISKTGNATILLSNQDSSAGSATVDAVIYQDPAWPSSTVYPQKTTLRGLGIVGDASSNNDSGIYILQGGVLTIDSIDVVNCVNGLLSKDLFLSDIRKLHTLGKIRIDNGTSVTLTDCWAKGHTSRAGAFDFTGLKYSAMNGCASDGAPNTAYVFDYCQALSMNGCGCEGAKAITANRGSAIAFKDKNSIVINGFACVPVVNSTPALITVGSNNHIKLSGWNSDSGNYNETDIYVYGNDSVLELHDSKFYNGRSPIVQISVGSTSKVVRYLGNGNIMVYSAPDVTGIAKREAFFDSGTWTPSLAFGGLSTDITYSTRTGTWVKNGSEVIISFRITLSSKGSATGTATMPLLPFISSFDEKVDFALISATTGGILSGTLDKKSTTAVLNVRGTTGDVNATDANFTNTTTLRGTIRLIAYNSVFY